jgi:hypothetical protein
MKVVNPKMIDNGEDEPMDIMELPVLEDFNPEEKWLIPVRGENGFRAEISINDLIDIISGK